MRTVTPENDLYPLDLVDPATKQHLEVTDGVEGEAIYTSLNRKTVPLLRFASGDIVRVSTGAPWPTAGCWTGWRRSSTGRIWADRPRAGNDHRRR